MRTALALCLAVALFASAALWHADRRGSAGRQVAAEEKPAPGSAARESARFTHPVPEGWVEVILGAPSGADPIRVPLWYTRPADEQLDLAESAPDAGNLEEHPTFLPTPGRPPDFELEVGPGQVLSRIAVHHYGTSRPRLVEALARYNGLDSPDKLREGQRLRLPPIEDLESADVGEADSP